MENEENEFVCSVKKENNLGYYRLHSIWKKDGFFLNIASRDGAWRGEMTQKDLTDISGQLGISSDIYLKQCKSALTSEQPEISYTVENGCFIWKKVDDQDSGIKIKMGFVMIQPANFVDIIQNVVSVALERNRRLEEEVCSLRQEKEKSVACKQELLNKLHESIKMKNLMENDLYGRFMLLLNSKKKKINELEIAAANKSNTSMDFSVEQTEYIDSSFKNPFDVDTESDSDEAEFSTSVPKKVKKEKLSDAGKKEVKVLTKNEEKSHTSVCNVLENEALTTKQSCASVDRTNTPKNPSKSTSRKKKTEIPSTKDELLDFFYG